MDEVASKKKWGKEQFVISYLAMRRSIGFLGFSMPFILAIGYALTSTGSGFRSSISAYYYTNMGDVFVGILCAVALFLFSYRGYESIDNIAGDMGAVFALGVAFFPCSPDKPIPDMKPLISTFHLIFAGLFFSVLIFFSMCLFTQSDTEKEDRNDMKILRNRIYRTCGVIMFICIGVIPVIEHWFHEWLVYNPEFWLESAALCAFGISWSIKGDTFFKDKTTIPD